ncbi:MAG: TIGR03792 family protein [Spirochaetales bacterium]|nr:TIGR03792 family protein [Spirochaetales bacterium]
MKLERIAKPEAVEQLIISIDPPDQVDRWIELDHEIWSKGLAKWPGYIRKEVWSNPDKPGILTILIYWESLEQWKAVDLDWLMETDRLFDESFFPAKAEIIGTPHEENQQYLIAHSSGIGD